MALPQRAAAHEDLVSYEPETNAPERERRRKDDHLLCERDPLSAARGVVLSVILGGLLWGLIIWGISLLFG